jgi:hypothetical protein
MTKIMFIFWGGGSMFRLPCWGAPRVPKMLVMGQESGSIWEKNQKRKKKPKPN